LNENNIGKLPQGLFAELIELNWLFLNANNLSEFGGGLFDALKSLQNLQCLDLADNELRLVGEAFPPMNNMTEL
jgi:Leucine-rich repeat (LRR) protein